MYFFIRAYNKLKIKVDIFPNITYVIIMISTKVIIINYLNKIRKLDTLPSNSLSMRSLKYSKDFSIFSTYSQASICSVLFLLLINISTYGQSRPNLFSKADYPQPVTASPEASALGKYGDVPVSLFSGLPDVSIPVYNFKVGDITVPIKLSYNMGGIRVDDIATNVGLGWSLNAGGVISKTELGGPDGSNNLTFPDKNFDPHKLEYYALGRLLIEEHKDLERDIYNYNFLNSSGKFVVNHSGKVCFFPSNPNIKIDLVENTSSPIVITDDNGFKYFFSITEGSKSTPVCSVGVPSEGEYPDGSTTAYYLSKIISPNNNQIDFEYEAYTYKVIKGYKEVKYEKAGNTDCPELTVQNRVCNLIQEFFGQRIKTIKSSDNSSSVEFSYATAKRLDLKFNGQDQGNYLDHIYIKRDGVQIKKWDLTYNYFGTGENLRLKLLAVKEDGQTPYEFGYDEQKPMPSRLSFSQDYWGFYNGKIALNTFIPPVPTLGKLSGADRNPDFDYMKSYSLNSIKYPTGGVTKFEYEPHQDYVTESTTDYVTESASISNTSGGVSDFLLPLGSAEFRLSWGLPTINQDDSFMGYILGGPNLTTVYKTVSGYGVETNLPTINPGANYRLSISSSNVDDRGDISFEWKRPVTTTRSFNKILYGGLRIKSVKNYIDNQLTGSKYYNYNWINNPLRSSIVLPNGANDYKVFNSIYNSPKINTGGGGAIFEGLCGYNVFSSSSAQSMGTALDNSIGYEQVSEISDENGVNGRTVYRYLVASIEGGKGSLLEKTEQKFEAGLYKNVRKLKNTYQQPLLNRDTIPSIKISYIQPEVAVWGSEQVVRIPAQFEVQKYLAISGRNQIQETTEITYNNNLIADSTVSRTNYTYNSPLHTYPATAENNKSDGKATKTTKKYVTDMVGPGMPPAYSSMLTANIIAPVIEENMVSQPDNQQLAYKRTNYSIFGSNIYQPSSIETSYGTANIETEIKFNKYDGYGNLLERQDLSGPKEVYLWGYKNRYPVAKITGMDYNSIIGTIDQNVLNNPASDEALKNYLNQQLRLGFPNAFVTTFTYLPLIGMTSSTDPKGMTTYYEYDAFGRLKSIRDQNKNIIKNYEYHLKIE